MTVYEYDGDEAEPSEWPDAMTSRQVPGFDTPMHDLDAERWLLSAMMAHPSAVEAAAEVLVPEHLFRPAHQVMFRALVAMFAAGEGADPVTLRDWLERDGDMRVFGGKGALYLAEVYGLHASPLSAGHYARIVHEHAVRRVLTEALGGLAADAANRAVDPVTASDRAVAKIRHAVSAARPEKQIYTLSEFLSLEFPGGGWVVDGLLGRQDRVVVVGPEGAGKTMLGHQVGYAAAAGVHPFSVHGGYEPRRVVILDFENPPTLLQRRTRRLQATAQRYAGWNPENMIVHAQPDGADLTDPREAFDLAQIIKRAEPDLIIAGPVYKLLGGGGDDDRLAAHRQIARFFDQMRVRHNCAIWLEAHAPYAGRDKLMRPEGSNIWCKWPEFGLGLRWATKAHGGMNGLDVVPFRGHREEGRNWPSWVTRNALPNGGWPWVAGYERGVTDVPLDEGSDGE